MAGEPLESICISDFDQTITTQHTFKNFNLTKHLDKNTEALFSLGKEYYSPTKIRNKLSNYLIHNNEALFAIATHHNNPAFIAGFLSGYLGVDLKFEESHFSETSPIAINQYQVPGIDRPLLISYIPRTGTEFDAAINQINYKNDQLLFLKDMLLKKGHINAESLIHFYDDSRRNCANSRLLESVIVHEVASSGDQFWLHLEEPSPYPLIDTDTETYSEEETIILEQEANHTPCSSSSSSSQQLEQLTLDMDALTLSCDSPLFFFYNNSPVRNSRGQSSSESSSFTKAL